MKPQKQAGFSLIELLIAMAITSVIAAAIYTVYRSSVESSMVQNTAAGVQQSVRAALEMMVQDIRMAGYYPNNFANEVERDSYFINKPAERIPGVMVLVNKDIQRWNGNSWVNEDDKARIEFINSDSIKVTSDRSGDGVIGNDSFEILIYELKDGVLRQISRGDAQPVINNVTNLIFTPVNQDGKVIAVDIELSVEENAGWGRTVERTLETRVFLRNI